MGLVWWGWDVVCGEGLGKSGRYDGGGVGREGEGGCGVGWLWEGRVGLGRVVVGWELCPIWVWWGIVG